LNLTCEPVAGTEYEQRESAQDDNEHRKPDQYH
jgi:hypothetical protein